MREDFPKHFKSPCNQVHLNWTWIAQIFVLFIYLFIFDTECGGSCR